MKIGFVILSLIVMNNDLKNRSMINYKIQYVMDSNQKKEVLNKY